MAPSTHRLAVNHATPLIDWVKFQEPWREKSRMLATTMKTAAAQERRSPAGMNRERTTSWANTRTTAKVPSQRFEPSAR